MSLPPPQNDTRAAQRRHDAGVPGFYVFAFAAQVIVAGPYKVLGTAEYQAALREPPSMGVTEVCRDAR